MNIPKTTINNCRKQIVTNGLVVFALLCAIQYSIALEIPELSQRVTDKAGILSPATVSQLNQVLASFEQEESTQIAVLTIGSLQGNNLESFALQVVEQWQLGREDLDNGALLLIARDDRKIRIEVGYGLEGSLTDLTAGRIIRNTITPQFKNGNFDQGVIDGVSAMINAVRGEYTGKVPKRAQGSQEEVTGYIIFISFLLFNLGKIFGRNKLLGGLVGAGVLPLAISLFVGFSWYMFLILIPAGFIVGYLSSLLMGRSRSTRRIGRGRKANSNNFPGGFGGGSFGGGGFSGGGGGFGGGGASGGW